MNAMLPQAIKAGATLPRERSSFDAIVIGAGAAGGLAAMLLTQAGLKVLSLDAGWRKPLHKAPLGRATSFLVKTVADPRLYNILPWGVLNAGRKTLNMLGSVRQPVQARCYAWPMAPDAFVDDRDAPYSTADGANFNWFRVRQIGGRMTVPGHGRQYWRLSPETLSESGGVGEPWPLAQGELNPWYESVERKLKLIGGQLASNDQPASLVSEKIELHAAERALCDAVKAKWANVSPMIGQWAAPMDTMESAAATGKLTCRTGAVVRDVDASEADGFKTVTWFDRGRGQDMKARAPLVFVGASALETARILMMSRAADGADGIGARSGVLGAGLMDHILVRGDGVGGKLGDEPFVPPPGRCVFLPRFDKRNDGQDGERPFGMQVYQSSYGADKSHFTVVSFGEMTARPENRVELDQTKTDAFGIPTLKISFHHDAGDRRAALEQSEAIRELADIAGAKLHHVDIEPDVGGTAMHEVGTARMGRSADRSVISPMSEAWDAPGVYVIDGAAMPAQGFQNPTLTIMALVARAVDHALKTSQPAKVDVQQVEKTFAE